MAYADNMTMPDGTNVEMGAKSENVSYGALSNVKAELDKLNEFYETGISAKKLKILLIGNSYCQNTLSCMKQLLSNLHVDGVSIYLFFSGGTTWDWWWDTYKNNGTNKTLECYSNDTIAEVETLKASTYTVQDILKAAKWDCVILQEYDKTSGIILDKTDAKLAHIVSHIRYDVDNANLRIGVQMQWPRCEGSAQLDTGNSGPTYIEGFEDVAEVTKGILDSGLVDFVIPQGTAIMNAGLNATLNTRISTDTNINENGNALLQADGNHLAQGIARYIVCCLFYYKVIYPAIGKDFKSSTLTLNAANPDTPGSIALTSQNRDMCHAVVMYAASNPWQISTLDFANI